MKKRVVNCFGLKINLLVSMSKGFLPGDVILKAAI